jgi:hypothetical protein
VGEDAGEARGEASYTFEHSKHKALRIAWCLRGARVWGWKLGNLVQETAGVFLDRWELDWVEVTACYSFNTSFAGFEGGGNGRGGEGSLILSTRILNGLRLRAAAAAALGPRAKFRGKQCAEKRVGATTMRKCITSTIGVNPPSVGTNVMG